MPDFSLVCPHCGGAIMAQTVAQTSLNLGASAEIAHDSKTLDLAVRKGYNQGYDQDFLGFWDVYPLKRDKRKAEKAWRNAVRRLGANPGANAETAKAQIIAGAIQYRDDPNRLDEFTKYAEGWLNGDGWEDDPLPKRNGHRAAPDRPKLALERLRRKER
jgi:hypothetical protein